jgi:S-ribosylhomocysteine lyase
MPTAGQIVEGRYTDRDHRYMEVPYLLRIGSHHNVSVWQLRIGQPNIAPVMHPILHTMEHFLQTYLASLDPGYILAAPMGCHTGLYLVTMTKDPDTMFDAVAESLTRIETATEVPHANVRACGWAACHTIDGARDVATWMLTRREEWGDPGQDARVLVEE